MVNKQPSDFWFHKVLCCFRVIIWSQFWTSSKFLSVPETTTNNQEVKRSLYRLQNVNNLPKDYIRMCLTICRRVVQVYRSCLTSRIHPFDFINSNVLQRSKISVVEDNNVRSEKDSTSKQAHVQFVNKEPSDFWFHQVLHCFRVVSSQFWTSSKWLLALETTWDYYE